MDYATGLELILADLIKRTRLRPLLDSRGDTKTLDQLAKGQRKTPYRLLLDIEKNVIEDIKNQCGEKWADWIQGHWAIVRYLEAFGITEHGWPDEPLPPASYHYVKTLIKHAFRDMEGPVQDEWLAHPFRAWVEYLSHSLKLDEQSIRKRICESLSKNKPGADSARTYRRWYNECMNIRTLPEGHRQFVQDAIGETCQTPITSETLDHFTGWFLLTIGIQSMSESERSILAISHPMTLPIISRPPHPYRLASQEEWIQASGFLHEVVSPYVYGHLNIEQLVALLDKWQADAENNTVLRVQYGRLRARIARARGEKAVELYDYIVRISAEAGWTDKEHHSCIRESLGYSLRIKDNHAFRNFWDAARKSFLFNEVAEQPTEIVMNYLYKYSEVDPRRLVLVYNLTGFGLVEMPAKEAMSMDLATTFPY